MSSFLPSSSGLTTQNYNYLKCWFTLIYDGKEVFQQIFQWGFGKPKTEIKSALFGLPNYSNSKYRSDFDASQRKKIENGDLSDFDLNLFYLLLQRICFLPNPSDKLWGRNGDPDSLPTILYLIKMKRNALAHTNIEISEGEMIREIDTLKSLFYKALDIASDIYNVQNCELVDIKNNIAVHILSVQSSNSALSQQNMKEIAKEKAILAINEAQIDLAITYKHLMKILLAPWTVAETFQNIKDVFTEPLIRQSKSNVLFQQLTEEESVINITNILVSKLPDNSIPNFVLVMSPSGMGKTTLVKYIIQSWMERTGCINGLDTIDLMLYMDFRGSRIKTFEDLITGLIPNTVKLFDMRELKLLIITMNVLVILDNVDEMPEEVLPTYEELLQLNSDNFRIFATSTQPLSRLLNKKCHQKHLKLQLEGISNSNINSCISKMYSSLYGTEGPHTNTESVEMFISEYLSKSHSHSREAVRSPEILSHVFFHWLMQSKKDSYYTTKTQLFLTTHDLLCLKLLDKLGTKSQTKLLEQKILYDKLNIFFDELFRIAFQTLSTNEKEILPPVFSDILDVCKRLDLPHTILKEVLCVQERQNKMPLRNYALITFPNTSLQVFYCAMHVISVCTSEDILNLDLINGYFYENMSKRNIYTMLIKFILGILAFNNILVLENSIKTIFIHITKYCKNCNTSTWLECLEETRFHSSIMMEVKKYIGETWTLEDYEISFGLITMLKTHPPKHITLTICTPPSEIYFFTKALQVCSQIPEITVSLQMYHNFWANKESFCDNFLNILAHNKNSLDNFAGKLSTEYILRIPTSIQRLALHIKPEDITILNSTLIRLRNLMLLYLNLDLSFNFPAKRLPRLKMPNSNILLYVDFWNISENYIQWACDAIQSFSPAYCRLALRKSSLDFLACKLFLGEVRQRRIHVDTIIIGTTKDITKEEEKELNDYANDFECSEVKIIQI